MASWREEYLKALSDRDERERAKYERISEDFIDAYTQLLDRTAALEAEKTTNKTALDSISNDPSPGTSNSTAHRDLTEALRANGQLQSRLRTAEAELLTLRAQTKSDTRRLDALTKERVVLIQKVKDRDEEIRGKAGLVQDTQDEMISLNLQLNMSEQNNKKLKKDNEELIGRWMERKEKEAEEMNRAWTES